MKALLVEQHSDKLSAGVQHIDESQLPIHEVIVDVHYSTLNYKDGLAITGKGKILRQFPMVPGIDFSGWFTIQKIPVFILDNMCY